jgi:hypothetical protein
MECHVVGDCNIDAQSFNRPDIASTPHNAKLRPLVEKLFERIFPHGVSQMVTSVTRQNSILDHYYCNKPCKLSQVQAENRGGSDHKLIMATRYSKAIKKHQKGVIKTSTLKNLKLLSGILDGGSCTSVKISTMLCTFFQPA